MRNWLYDENVKVGDCISVLGALESFQDKVQLNIHRLRVIKEVGEELLQYQHTDMVQRSYFDPMVPFERRLLTQSAAQITQARQEAAEKQKKEQAEEDARVEAGLDINYYSIARVRKNLNNQIVSKFKSIFDSAGGEINVDTFLSNSAIVSEAESELKLCRARERQTVDKLLQVCLAELAERNYIEFSSDGKRIKMKYESRVLVDFIRDELRKKLAGQVFNPARLEALKLVPRAPLPFGPTRDTPAMVGLRARTFLRPCHGMQ